MARLAGAVPLALVLSCGGLFAACVIDLAGLSSGGASSSSSSAGSTGATGGSTSVSGSSTSAGGSDAGDAPDAQVTTNDGGADAGCALLDCSCAPGPTVIAAGAAVADAPLGVVAASDGVYWVNKQGNELRRLSAAGGPPELLAATTAPGALAVSGDTVVWTAADGLHACQASSCSASAHRVAASAAVGSLRGVAFDGQIVAWGDDGTGSQDGKVRACPLGACGAPDDLDTNLTAPAGLAYHDAAVFFVDQGDGNQNGVIHSELKVGGAYTQIAASLDLPTGIAVDDTYVYWTAWIPTGHVYRCAFAGGPCAAPTDIAPAQGALGRPFDIQVAGGRIYWSQTDDGSIRSCPQPGCGSATPQVHVNGRQGLHRIAVGASCLFWTEDTGGGAVLKMAR